MTLCPQQEAVHLFLDGELRLGAQTDLFAHLSRCGACRGIMNAMMEFRRMSRQEVIHVPSAVDEVVLAGLKQSKRRRSRRDRYYDRRPLWQSRVTFSLRAGMAFAALFFALGVLLPYQTRTPRSPVFVAEQEDDQRLRSARLGPLYVWYPGLLVEAQRDKEPGDVM